MQSCKQMFRLRWWWYFSSPAQTGGRFDDSFPACASFFFLFFQKLRSTCIHQFHFFDQDQSTVAQWAKMTVAKCSLTSCMYVCFPGRFLHYGWTAQSANSNFFGSRVYARSGVTCHLHFWQNDQGLLHATAVTRRWNGSWIRAQKLNPGEENSPAAPAKTWTFWSWVWCSTNKLSQFEWQHLYTSNSAQGNKLFVVQWN